MIADEIPFNVKVVIEFLRNKQLKCRVLCVVSSSVSWKHPGRSTDSDGVATRRKDVVSFTTLALEPNEHAWPSSRIIEEETEETNWISKEVITGWKQVHDRDLPLYINWITTKRFKEMLKT